MTPGTLDAGMLRDALLGRLSTPVALMRLLLTGLPAATVVSELRRHAARRNLPSAQQARLDALLELAGRAHEGLVTVERMVAAGADHYSTDTGPDAVRMMFDRLVAISPEASVAAYSLGDADRLAAGTAEIVAWLRDRALLQHRPDILDLGCGIGRCCVALSPVAARVVGVETSAGMLRVARERCAGMPNVGFVRTSGRDLACLADAVFDVVLAADVFPYLVQAGAGFVEGHLADAARVLRPGGSLVVLNYSYRGLDRDRFELPRLAKAAGLDVVIDGEAGFRLWDGVAFWLRRP